MPRVLAENPRPADAATPFVEGEPTPRYPVFITGGAGAAGQVIAERFAREGFPLIIGTRSPDKFAQMRDSFVKSGIGELRPFIANITNPAEVTQALNDLNLQEGESLHFFSLAAEGLRGIRMKLFRIMAPLLKDAKNGAVTQEGVNNATEAIKQLVTTEEALAEGMAANYVGPRDLATMLVQRNHLHSGSRIVTLSSSISHDTDPDKMDAYTGPWFYVPIGVSKEMGVRSLRGMSEEEEIGMIDVVAPKIQGTDVAEFLEGLAPIFQQLNPDVLFSTPSVTKDQVANTMYLEFARNDPALSLQRTVFVGDNGMPAYDRPQSWGSSLVPYL